VNVDTGEDIGELAKLQRRRRKQQLGCLSKQLGIDGGKRETGHLSPWAWPMQKRSVLSGRALRDTSPFPNASLLS
jgi:hypothetical protein